jgi:hypothetical protein
LPIISITAPVPCETGFAAAGAPPSACRTKAKAAVKIGIHLNIHGIRRDSGLQVIDLVHSKPSISGSLAVTRGVRAMLRSDSPFMLVELRAENYAVIDHAIAVFGPGLNLLTGETGAGKSILVDALALLMGGKASAEIVRHGAEKAVVACVFESTPAAEAVLEENGIDA